MALNQKFAIFCLTILISYTDVNGQDSTANIYSEIVCINLMKIHGPLKECNSFSVTTESSTTTSSTSIPIKSDANVNKCNEGEICVDYILCANNTVAKHGSNLLIDLRGAQDGTGPCPYLQQCCQHNQIGMRSNIPPAVKTILFPNITQKGCGHRNKEGIFIRITGNEKNETEFGEFPWMTAVLLKAEDNENVLIYRCGGTIIHPSVVITALHCINVREAHEIVVRGAEWDIRNNGEHVQHQDRYVKEIIKHENYYKGGFYNDIALLLLTEPFLMIPHIQPVCLPPTGTVFDGKRCFLTGWGTDTSHDTATYSTILKKIDLPIVPNDQCQEAVRKNPNYGTFNLHESFICAGGELGKDACKGDGGSPLVCPIPNTVERYYLAGIVSWGIACGESGLPGFYASIPYLRSWIDEHLDLKSIDKTSFIL